MVAPTGMAMPGYVRSRLGRRPEYVLNHGFDDRSIGSHWWNERLLAHGLDQRFELNGRDERRLTRQDLFAFAQPAGRSGASAGDVLTLLWHVLAWGTGKSQRGNNMRIRAFADPSDRQRHVGLLREAIASARGGDPTSAYGALIRRGGGQIRGLGPAFFTKFLYFASEGAAGTRCLILDARVAGSLAQTGWSSLQRSTRTNYGYNWHTVTYVSYRELLQRWATEESDQSGTEIWPDEIERALFDGEPSGSP